MGPASSIAVSTGWCRVRALNGKLRGKCGRPAAKEAAEVSKNTSVLHSSEVGVAVFGVMLLCVTPQWVFFGSSVVADLF